MVKIHMELDLDKKDELDKAHEIIDKLGDDAEAMDNDEYTDGEDDVYDNVDTEDNNVEESVDDDEDTEEPVDEDSDIDEDKDTDEDDEDEPPRKIKKVISKKK